MQYFITENQNKCQLATVRRINPKTEWTFPIAVVHTLTKFHDNHLQTSRRILFNRQMDGQTLAKTLPPWQRY